MTHAQLVCEVMRERGCRDEERLAQAGRDASMNVPGVAGKIVPEADVASIKARLHAKFDLIDSNPMLERLAREVLAVAAARFASKN